MKKITLLTIIILLFAGNTHAISRTLETAAPDSVIDVPKYLVAGWWKGRDREAFDSTTWYRNTAFTVALNPEMLWKNGNYDHNFFNFGLYFRKEFNPSSAASFGLKFANSDRIDEYKFHRFGMELGYLWNLSNFYYGMNRSRRFNVLASSGLEFGKIRGDESYKKAYYGGYLGLRLSRTFSPHSDFFIEPRLGIYSDSYDALDGPHGFDALASAHVGMNYKLSEMYNIVPPKSKIDVLHMKNWFIELGGDMILPVPRMDYIYEGSAYKDRIIYGASFGLGYRVNPLSTGRIRFTYAEDRFSDTRQYLTALDLVLSGTNMFLGENENRYVDMGLVLGPLIQFAKVPEEDKNHINWGAEMGLQFTRRITPTWELFLEPRFQLVQDYTKVAGTDKNLKKRWDMNAGMVYLYTKRERQRFDTDKPFQSWFFQTNVSAQLNSLTTGHQIGAFNFAFGRHFGSLISLRASVMSGELQSDEPNYDNKDNPMFVSYCGGRLEMVTNLLRMMTPSLEKSRWNLNISGGMEYGLLSNHYKKDWAVMVGSQLQYRFSPKAWIVAGGTVEQPLHFDAKLPLSAHLGLQYDLKDEKRMDILENYWRWYVQSGLGFHNVFWNMDKFAYNVTTGIFMTPSQGARIEFIGTKKERDKDGKLKNWMSISPEYVLNLSNMVLGEDYDRKIDLEFYSGIDFMLHSGKVNVGFNFGTQVDAYLNNSLALFVEPRFSLQPFDKIIAPGSHDVLQYHTLIGLRYIHNRFYTRDEDKYRDLFNKDYKFLEYLEETKQWFRSWRPFEKFHPIQYIKQWHPRENYRVIKEKPLRRESQPLQNWYVAASADVQLANLTSGHQQGSFEFTLGRKLNPLWNVQASVFSGTLQSNEPNYDESYNPMFSLWYGGRAEVVFNFLRLCARSIKDSRWNANVSGGWEMGHLTNHHQKDWAFVASSQLQYRAGSHTWYFLGGRAEKLKNFDARRPISVFGGIQYDLNTEKRYDIIPNNWRWYVQAGAGFQDAFWNMDRKAVNLAVGLNFTPVHGMRFEYVGTKKNMVDGVYHNWMSFSPEYVFNLSNKKLGEDDKRFVDIELFAGLDYMKHEQGMRNTKVGINFGTQINANIYKGLSLYLQPRFSYLPNDKILAPTSHDRLHVFTLIGLRYTHNKFKSTKPEKKQKKAKQSKQKNSEQQEIELEWQ